MRGRGQGRYNNNIAQTDKNRDPPQCFRCGTKSYLEKNCRAPSHLVKWYEEIRDWQPYIYKYSQNGATQPTITIQRARDKCLQTLKEPPKFYISAEPSEHPYEKTTGQICKICT